SRYLVGRFGSTWALCIRDSCVLNSADSSAERGELQKATGRLGFTPSPQRGGGNYGRRRPSGIVSPRSCSFSSTNRLPMGSRSVESDAATEERLKSGHAVSGSNLREHVVCHRSARRRGLRSSVDSRGRRMPRRPTSSAREGDGDKRRGHIFAAV